MDLDRQKVMHNAKKVLLLQTEKNSKLAVQERSWREIVCENDSWVFRRGQMGGQKCSWERHSKAHCAGCQHTMHGTALFISEMKRNWERDKNKGEGWPKASVQRETEQIRTILSGEDVAEKTNESPLQNHGRCGDLTGNYVHCLTDTEITKHQVSLPGGRFKTMGRGSFIQCMISCGATCCRTLQAVRFFIAPRKTKETIFQGVVNTKASLLAQEVNTGLSSCYPHHHTCGLTRECYNYMVMAVSQSCRFQRREEMSEKTCRA